MATEQAPQSQEPAAQQIVVIERPGNGLATAGFVCGLVGAILGLIPFMFLFSFILGPLGIIFGGIGWKHAAERGRGKGLAISGVILGVVAVALAILWMVAWSSI